MPPHQTRSSDFTIDTPGTADVLLTALGKTWGRLVGGSVLEIRRGDQVVCFDLAATARAGRPVLCQVGAAEQCRIYCERRTSVLE